MIKSLNILVAGEGGQGVQAIVQILNEAANREKKESIYIPNYGVEQRGGVSLGFLQIGNSPIAYPKFKTADIAVVLCERAIPRVKQYVGRKTQIINGIYFIDKPKEHNLPPRTYNMMILGVLSEFVPLKSEAILSVMHDKFAGKKIDPKLLEQNKQSYLLGRVLGSRIPHHAQGLNAFHLESDHRKWPADIRESKSKISHTIHRKYCKSCGICIHRSSLENFKRWAIFSAISADNLSCP